MRVEISWLAVRHLILSSVAGEASEEEFAHIFAMIGENGEERGPLRRLETSFFP